MTTTRLDTAIEVVLAQWTSLKPAVKVVEANATQLKNAPSLGDVGLSWLNALTN